MADTSSTSADAPELADQVAEAVRAVPGVHDLHGGVLGEVGTYLPGRRVAGVRIEDQRCEVHVALEWDADLAATVEAVRTAVRPLVGGAVDVTVEDLVLPADDAPAAPAAPAGAPGA